VGIKALLQESMRWCRRDPIGLREMAVKGIWSEDLARPAPSQLQRERPSAVALLSAPTAPCRLVSDTPSAWPVVGSDVLVPRRPPVRTPFYRSIPLRPRTGAMPPSPVVLGSDAVTVGPAATNGDFLCSVKAVTAITTTTAARRAMMPPLIPFAISIPAVRHRFSSLELRCIVMVQHDLTARGKHALAGERSSCAHRGDTRMPPVLAL
jgi:hypothetical protein